MSWYKYNGKILKENGRVAISRDCCCTGCPCCDKLQEHFCPPFEPATPSGLSVFVYNIDGMECLNGIEIPLFCLEPNIPDCFQPFWDGQVSTGVCGAEAIAAQFWCCWRPIFGTTNCEQTPDDQTWLILSCSSGLGPQIFNSPGTIRSCDVVSGNGIHIDFGPEPFGCGVSSGTIRAELRRS